MRSIHKKVHELRHGKDPAEMGGTNIDGGFHKSLAKGFKVDERSTWQNGFESISEILPGGAQGPVSWTEKVKTG